MSLLDNLEAFLRALFRFSLRHPRRTLALLTLLTLLCAAGLGRLRAHLNFTDYAPTDSPALAAYKDYLEDFPDRRHSLLLRFTPPPEKAFTERDLCNIRGALHQEEAVNAAVITITSPFSLRRPSFSDGKMWHLPWLASDCTSRDANLSAAFRESPWDAVFTGNGQDLLVEVLLREGSREGFFGRFDPRLVPAMYARLAHAVSPIRVETLGFEGFERYKIAAVESDQTINLVLVTVMLVLFRCLFGRWRAGFLVIGTLVFTALMLFGAMAWAGRPIDFLSNGLFPIVLVAVIEDAVFLCALRMGEPRLPWQDVFARLLLPSFLTSLTTILSFFSLGVSDLAIIRNFGLWAGLGALLEWIFLFLGLPALLQLCPRLQEFAAPGKRWEGVVRFRLPRPLAMALLVCLPLGVAGAFLLRVSDDPKEVFSVSHPFRQGSEEAAARRGWESFLQLHFGGDVAEARARALTNEIRALPGVVRVQDPWSVRDALTGHLPPTVAALAEREFSLTPFHRQWFSPSGATSVLLFVESNDLDALALLRERIEKVCRNQCRAVGDPLTYLDFSSRVVPTLLESFAVSLLLVSGILAWIARFRLRTLLPALAASFWGIGCILALLALLQVRINFVTCIFAAVLVGLAGDNAIQFLLARREGSLADGMDTLGHGAFLALLVMVLGTSVLLLSDFAVTRSLARLLLLGFALNLVGDLWLLRGLLRRT